MRFLVLIASLTLAGNVVADEKHKPVSVTKEVDKSSPLAASGSGDEGNSTSDAQAAAERREKGSGLATGKRGPSSNLHAEGVVHRDVATRSQTEGADYNSSRSNKTHTSAQPPSPDSTTDSDCPADGNCGDRSADAQDYNSSRSNNINGTATDGEDLHVRKKPGGR